MRVPRAFGSQASSHKCQLALALAQLASPARRSATAANAYSVAYAVSDGLQHDWAGHPEHAGRVTAAVKGLHDSGLATHSRVHELKYDAASPNTVKLVHAPNFVDGLKDIVGAYVRILACCSPC